MLTLLNNEEIDRHRDIQVVLELTATTFAEIRDKLIRRGTGGAFSEHPRGGEMIELTGVAICAEKHSANRRKKQRA